MYINLIPVHIYIYVKYIHRHIECHGSDNHKRSSRSKQIVVDKPPILAPGKGTATIPGLGCWALLAVR